jgi:mevalonate kinase
VPNSNFYSNGKLLLTSEYLVLDGALALALPTKYGQSLVVKPSTSSFIDWKSFDKNDTIWFEDTLLLDDFDLLKKHGDNPISEKLIEILIAAKQLNPDFNISHVALETHLTFPREWGLGTSSTLINNVASWAQVDPYELLELTFGGSGYDIACAQLNTPLTYHLTDKSRDIQTIDFNPKFKDSLYFVYLNKKQNSRDAINVYRKNTFDLSEAVTLINDITKSIINCKTLAEFEALITQHEHIIGNIIKQKPIKERLFPDFEGAIKSLGAWGGDFVLATTTENPSTYFKSKGFDTVISYQNLIL